MARTLIIQLIVLLLSETAFSQWPELPDTQGNCQHNLPPTDRQGQDPNYWGCFADDDGNMMMGTLKTDPILSHQNCFEFCQQRSYRFAGMRDGVECHCAFTFDRRRYVRVSDRECYYECPGDSNRQQRCGARQRVTLFSLR